MGKMNVYGVGVCLESPTSGMLCHSSDETPSKPLKNNEKSSVRIKLLFLEMFFCSGEDPDPYPVIFGLPTILKVIKMFSKKQVFWHSVFSMEILYIFSPFPRFNMSKLG